MDKRNSGLDKKLDANAAMKEVEQIILKEDERRWGKTIAAPVVLADNLATLTKTELSDIRARLGIRGLSSLNKQQLAEALETHIPQSFGAMLEKLDEERYKLLRQIVDRGGIMASSNYWGYGYFVEMGVLVTGSQEGNTVVAMPKEVMEQFQKSNSAELRDKISNNTEVIKLTRGLLYYYGVLSLEDLEQLLARYIKEPFDFREVLELLVESSIYNGVIEYDDYGFAFCSVEDPAWVLEEQRNRSDLQFYSFMKRQLLEAGEIDYIDRHPVFEAMSNYITDNYPLDREDADGIVEECADSIRNGGTPSDVLELLQEQLEIDTLETVQGFMGHLSMLNNLTKQWLLKGYSPNELAYLRNERQGGAGEVIDMFSRKKIGRNDLCPCGSGKKYKKCCGA
ncbi:SEC-C metal-binding domain-containing protein [Paenibacillus sp. GCM10027626]|uniref:YecA family protein n=1 Tax=Paenibacillus sp. GCM10027626 TaxID=3273411 RepID=UPI003630F220